MIIDDEVECEVWNLYTDRNEDSISSLCFNAGWNYARCNPKDLPSSKPSRSHFSCRKMTLDAWQLTDFLRSQKQKQKKEKRKASLFENGLKLSVHFPVSLLSLALWRWRWRLMATGFRAWHFELARLPLPPLHSCTNCCRKPTYLFTHTKVSMIQRLIFFALFLSRQGASGFGTPPPKVLRELLQSQMDGSRGDSKPILLPCCYDGLSARLVARAGFEATFMTGFGVSGVNGYPDTQLLSYDEMRRAANYVSEGLTSAAQEYNQKPIPCIADGDTGYGNSLNVKRTLVSNFATS